MNKLLRRIVTSEDENGNAIFEADDTPEVIFTNETEWPGFNNVEYWQTDATPPDLTEKFKRTQPYDFDIPPGVTRFCSMRLPPLKKLVAFQELQGKTVDLGTFGMHKTNTIDYLVLLSGEVTLILEGGAEKTLQPGDLVVQKGNVHAWHNRGEEDCIMLAVMVGAKAISQ